MSRGSIGESIDKGLIIAGALVAAVVAAIVFVVRTIIENAVWDGIGAGLDAAGRGDLSLAWNVLGLALTIVFVIGLALWLADRLGVTSGHPGWL